MKTYSDCLRVYNKHHQNAPSDAVYVGRGSPWGNPFVIGKDGSREDVCDKYQAWFSSQPHLVKEAKDKLKGKNLVCYCSPHRCHGDFLLFVANT